ncbi:MAG: virulence protein SciE type [Planctomycetales bacterium]|nr:virulence protein SciE type [Planctomycetales bacterium]
MLAEEKLRAGDVDGALAELKSAVQRNPAEAKYRVFLFQLLAVGGKWNSALNQLEIAGELEPINLAMVQAYRQAMQCESLRERVFAGEASPLIFGQPERWLALLLEALKLTAAGQFSQAQGLRGEALEAAPATSGTLHLSGQRQADFEWLADADSRLGPVMEAYLNGQYYWIPLHRIAAVDVEEPADLRDFVWTPAHFTWANGGQSVAMIPTRYPGSESESDSLLRLARRTEWRSVGTSDDPQGELFCGLGQRMLATDREEYALLDVRRLELQVDSESPEATEATEQAPGSES